MWPSTGLLQFSGESSSSSLVDLSLSLSESGSGISVVVFFEDDPSGSE